jgi:CRISPR-associated protein Csb1
MRKLLCLQRKRRVTWIYEGKGGEWIVVDLKYLDFLLHLDRYLEVMNATELESKLLKACTSGMSGLRTIVKLAPVGGDGDKVAPPTHEGGQYAFETRVIEGRQDVETVLLDSVQSQANRFEEALLRSVLSNRIRLPLVQLDLPGRGTLTSLSVPHRVHDAIFRDSRYQNERFRDSAIGKEMASARAWNATAMFRVCPTALLFGTWDSQSEGGVNSAKFARSLVSEIIGIDVKQGVKTASRIDPLGIKKMEGLVFKSATEQWTLDKTKAQQSGGKPQLYGPKKGAKGTPAEINHGNIPPTIKDGGVTFREARQTAVLSFAQIRKLRFPIDGQTSSKETDVDVAGRAVIAALGVVALALQIEEGYQLRSRCQLIPIKEPQYEWLGRTAAEHHHDEISIEAALGALESLSAHAKSLNLTWEEEPILLEPEQKLLDLLAKSDASTEVEE